MNGWLIAAAGAAFYYLSIKNGDGAELINPGPESNPLPRPGTKAPGVPAGIWPLRKGHRGETVKRLQLALLEKGGEPARTIRMSGGADGVFGNGLAKALKSAGHSETVSFELFQKITDLKLDKDARTADNRKRVFVSVNSWDGERIFKGVSDRRNLISGYGKDAIIKLMNRRHVGEATGLEKNGMAQVRFNIGGQDYLAWIDKTQASFHTELDFNLLFCDKITAKSDHEKSLIQKAFRS
ncbi:hypothetical protein FUAX_09780 [Fulvitalea axinellae]|uniref:LytR family transcriptional regulator n=1 Tax=Fulvitalea axinellae TaxID=1182444 RepID=A0AAU9D6S4_9BACT|nr:hypothetical protein FUAX_09780 [Fulvitalea axinellae]